MVAFKGRSFLKQYLPNKPSKCGLKLWGRSEISGYIYDFGIYQGKVKDTWGLKYTWCGGVCCNMSSALLSDHNLKVFLTITSQLYHCWMTSNNIKSGMLGQHGLTVPANDLCYVKKLKKKVKKRLWKLWLPYWYNFKWNNSSLVLKQSGHISFLVCRYWTRQVCEALW